MIDNSGSMVIGDGHRIVETSDRKIIEQAVSRWEEIQDTVFYHSQMAVRQKNGLLHPLYSF